VHDQLFDSMPRRIEPAEPFVLDDVFRQLDESGATRARLRFVERRAWDAALVRESFSPRQEQRAGANGVLGRSPPSLLARPPYHPPR
jgi:hypothetical protein